MQEKTFIVAIPVPCLDMAGNPLKAKQRKLWTRKAQELLTSCFGGATPIPAPGTNIVHDPITGEAHLLFEESQVLVISACGSREEFLSRRRRIELFAKHMGRALHQDSVFVLAFPSDSFLIEITYEKKRQGSLHRSHRRRRPPKEGKEG